jgi:hypothetical protein
VVRSICLECDTNRTFLPELGIHGSAASKIDLTLPLGQLPLDLTNHLPARIRPNPLLLLLLTSLTPHFIIYQYTPEHKSAGLELLHDPHQGKPINLVLRRGNIIVLIEVVPELIDHELLVDGLPLRVVDPVFDGVQVLFGGVPDLLDCREVDVLESA